jgi:hypothetical protein
MEIDATFQNQRAHQVLLSAGDEHLTAYGRRGVYSALQGGGIERFAIAGGAVVASIEDAPLGPQRPERTESGAPCKAYYCSPRGVSISHVLTEYPGLVLHGAVPPAFCKRERLYLFIRIHRAAAWHWRQA